MASCQYAAALGGGHCGRTVVRIQSISHPQVAKERDAVREAPQMIISDDKGGLCKTWKNSRVVRALYVYFLR